MSASLNLRDLDIQIADMGKAERNSRLRDLKRRDGPRGLPLTERIELVALSGNTSVFKAEIIVYQRIAEGEYDIIGLTFGPSMRITRRGIANSER